MIFICSFHFRGKSDAEPFLASLLHIFFIVYISIFVKLLVQVLGDIQLLESIP